MPLAVYLDGHATPFVLGFATASACSVAFGFVFVLSGAASGLSGAIAESTTASELNHFKRRGWRVVHGLKVRFQSDIDHVLVGPGGVLVVETKWSADEWPASRSERGFMADRLQRAIAQTEKAIIQVQGTFGGVARRPGVTCGVLVLDCPAGGERWPTYTTEKSNITVLRAAELADWLAKRPTDVLTTPQVDEFSDSVAAHVVAFDERERTAGLQYRPTLQEWFNRWFLFPVFAFVLTGIAALSIIRLGSWWGVAAVLAGTLVILRRLWSHRPYRPALVGGAAAVGVYAVVLAMALARWGLAVT